MTVDGAGRVRLTGRVREPRTLGMAELRALPGRAVEVEFSCGRSGPRRHRFAGPLLTDVIALAGPLAADGDRMNRLRHLVTVLGGDGHGLVLSWGELDAEFGAVPVLLGVRRDGRDLTEGPQLVVPGDRCGARHVSRIVEISLQEGVPPGPDRSVGARP